MIVTDPPAAPATPSRTRRAHFSDLAAVAAACGLVAAAVIIGHELVARGVPLLVEFPPLLARWEPHTGPGTVAAVLIALVVATAGPGYAATRPWRRVLAVAALASLAWTVALALVDGVERGFAGRLTTLTEYLHEVPRIRAIGVGTFLERFAELVPNDQPGFWATHVAGHPPLATLVFVGLDAVGLGGGMIASTAVVLVVATTVVALGVTLRALGAEAAARRVIPFAVLFPGAVWAGVSADGMGAAVLAWGVALTALACADDGAGRRGRSALLALAGGIVLGGGLFMNYGLSVGLAVPLAVVVLTGAWRVLVPGAIGAAGLAAVFALAGFWWLDGYHALLLRYSQPGEYGGMRPYSYFVWANIAALLLVIGPAVVAGLRRLIAERPARGGADPESRTWIVVAVLVGAALIAVTLADLSGLSKAEVERIWLPFAIWLLPAAALLPDGRLRGWLASQAVLALAVNHLLFTTW